MKCISISLTSLSSQGQQQKIRIKFTGDFQRPDNPMIKSGTQNNLNDQQQELDLNIVDSEQSSNTYTSNDQSQKNNFVTNTKQTTNHLNIQNMVQTQKNKSFQNTNQLTIEQIKQQILVHTPDMKDKIDILDDQTVRQIYYNFVEPNQVLLSKPQPQQINSKPNNRIEQQKFDYEPLQNPKKSIQRNPQILRMIQQIVKNVPHYAEEVDTFSDNEIKQLYASIDEIQPKPQQKKLTDIQSIKRFFQENTDMKGDLQFLEDQDIIEVYEQFIQSQKHRERMPPPQKRGRGRHPRPVSTKPPLQNGPMGYDPLKKFQNPIKLQSNINPQQSYFGMHSQYPQFQQPIPSNHTIKSGPGYLNRNPSQFSRPNNQAQMHCFINGQRTNTMNHMFNPNLTRTVVLFHSMEPGYVPQTLQKPKCKCTCCIRHHNQMTNSNLLGSFMQQLMSKYAGKR